MFVQQVQQFHQLVRSQDVGSALAAIGPLVQQAGQLPRSEANAQLTPAVAYLAPAIAAAPVPFVAAMAATAAGAMVELGAQPGPLTRVVLDRLSSALTGTHAFIDTWLAHAGGRPMPERDQMSISMAAGVLGGQLGPDRAMPLVSAWRDAPQWALAAVACLQHADARAQLKDRSTWLTQVDPLHSAAPQFLRLILVLRIVDEHMLVVHRPTRRGAMVWVSGVADNFQLQTLLAEALIGSGLLQGQRPDPRWVSAFRSGPDGSELEHVDDHFQLADAGGAVLRNEAGPADIAVINRVRVVVLDEAKYSRHWRPGRRFPIPAEVRLERVLSQDEVDAWLGYVAPATE